MELDGGAQKVEGALVCFFFRQDGEIRIILQKRRDPYVIKGEKVNILEFCGGGLEEQEAYLHGAYREASEEAFSGIMDPEKMLLCTSWERRSVAQTQPSILLLHQSIVKAVGDGRTDFAAIFVAEIDAKTAQEVLTNQERFLTNPEVSGTMSISLTELQEESYLKKLSPTQREKVVPIVVATIKNFEW